MIAPSIKRIATASALLASIALPGFAQRGSADFTRYVAIGDSFGAGIQSASLVMSHQIYSYPSVIARQAGSVDFQQPLVSEPGIAPELQLTSLIPFPVIGPKSATNGFPINLTLPRPYNNLSIPGANVNDVLTLTGREPATSTETIFAQFILRGQGTVVQQALVQQPTFISVFIGGNDVLGAVLDGTPAQLTPAASFQTDYNRLLDALVAGAPNAGIITGTVPDPSVIPYASTIPPVIINPATGAPLLVGGQPVFMFADLGGGQLGILPPGSLVLLTASSLLGSGYGIPPPLAPAFPTLPNAGRPLPDSAVLTPTELAAIRARTVEINNIIRTASAARQIPVVDLVAEFAGLDEGLTYAGVTLDNSFVTGGVFSFDGFHLTDIGYTLFANAFIRKINESWHTDIPLASLLPFFQGNAPYDQFARLSPTDYVFSAPAVRSTKWIYGVPMTVKSQKAKRPSTPKF